MKSREVIIAAVFSLVLGTSVTLALGGSREIGLGRTLGAERGSVAAYTPEPLEAISARSTPTSPVTARPMVVVTNQISSAPVITIWQARTQNFGFLGNPQKMINILGNVFDPHGVSSLSYSLNEGPQMPLCIGAREFPNCDPIIRLISPGDFNIEIDINDLIVSQNTLVITAVDEFNNQSIETVTIQYSGENTWPQRYTIDWNAVESIVDVAQIVDGQWMLETDSIRPAVIGYDRVVAIGDISWEDYEVIVPITIHNYQWANDGGIGIVARWQGHFVQFQEQPGYGWWNIGAYGFYQNRQPENGGPYLALETGRGIMLKDHEVDLDLEVTYYFKMRVETKSTGLPGFYSFKVWEAGKPEPSGWHFEKQDEPPNQPLNGSLLLVAHRVDASFGDVTIVPISEPEIPDAADDAVDFES